MSNNTTKIWQKLKEMNIHIDKHILLYFHKNKHIHHSNHIGIHMGELMLIAIVWMMSLMFAWGIGLPNNDDLEYPLQEVSTLECRTQYWEEMPSECKIPLPIINGANYEQYKDTLVYRQIYTVLFGWSYSSWRSIHSGWHQAVDIATARGTPLYSIGDGEVVFAEEQAWYGKMVRVKYLFQGKYIYALYVHLDTIEVQKGDMVKKGQRVGTVGNSWIVISGWLGWYHLHFQIDRDVNGRAARSYESCIDLPLGHYKIIQNGLCTEELLTYQYDPIMLLENNTIDKNDLRQIKQTVEATTPEQETIVDTGAIIIENNEPIENTGHNSPEETIEEVLPTTVTNLTDITINQETLSEGMKTFLKQRKIDITKTDKTSMKVWESTSFTIRIQDINGNKFNGIMPSAMNLITSNTNVITDYVSIKRISDGIFNIQITGRKTWSSVILISIDWQTIAKLPITIN